MMLAKLRDVCYAPASDRSAKMPFGQCRAAAGSLRRSWLDENKDR